MRLEPRTHDADRPSRKTPTVLEAALWGFVGGAALLLGAAVALARREPIEKRVIAYVMAFGSGVLISAVAYDLTQEALELGGGDAVALGLAGGALVFALGDHAIKRRGGGDRKRSGGQQADGSPKAIALGALLDGIPESAAIGITLIEGGGVGVALVAAVFLSNLPESLSASTGFDRAGYPRRRILELWGVIAVASAVAAAIGYGVLSGASENLQATTKAFAGGAILTMLASTMMPEAYEDSGRSVGVGLVTVLGFALAAGLTSIS